MAQPRRLFRKVMKVLAYGSALVIAILVIAHLAWKYSGSNEWELVQEKKGVRVYALKVPGVTRQQFKAVTRINTTLDRIVATMTDTTTEGCRNFVPGCVSGAILKPWDSQSRNYIQAYRILVPPLSPRDLVVKTQVSRDPQSNALLVECTALPEMTPTNAGHVRMTDMHNRWRFTPVENGAIDLEFVQNDDPRVPYFMYNRLVPRGLLGMARTANRAFNREKYRNAEFAFLKES